MVGDLTSEMQGIVGDLTANLDDRFANDMAQIREELAGQFPDQFPAGAPPAPEPTGKRVPTSPRAAAPPEEIASVPPSADRAVDRLLADIEQELALPPPEKAPGPPAVPASPALPPGESGGELDEGAPPATPALDVDAADVPADEEIAANLGDMEDILSGITGELDRDWEQEQTRIKQEVEQRFGLDDDIPPAPSATEPEPLESIAPPHPPPPFEPPWAEEPGGPPPAPGVAESTEPLRTPAEAEPSTTPGLEVNEAEIPTDEEIAPDLGDMEGILSDITGDLDRGWQEEQARIKQEVEQQFGLAPEATEPPPAGERAAAPPHEPAPPDEAAPPLGDLAALVGTGAGGDVGGEELEASIDDIFRRHGQQDAIRMFDSDEALRTLRSALWPALSRPEPEPRPAPSHPSRVPSGGVEAWPAPSPGAATATATATPPLPRIDDMLDTLIGAPIAGTLPGKPALDEPGTLPDADELLAGDLPAPAELGPAAEQADRLSELAAGLPAEELAADDDLDALLAQPPVVESAPEEAAEIEAAPADAAIEPPPEAEPAEELAADDDLDALLAQAEPAAELFPAPPVSAAEAVPSPAEPPARKPAPMHDLEKPPRTEALDHADALLDGTGDLLADLDFGAPEESPTPLPDAASGADEMVALEELEPLPEEPLFTETAPLPASAVTPERQEAEAALTITAPPRPAPPAEPALPDADDLLAALGEEGTPTVALAEIATGPEPAATLDLDALAAELAGGPPAVGGKVAKNAAQPPVEIETPAVDAAATEAGDAAFEAMADELASEVAAPPEPPAAAATPATAAAETPPPAPAAPAGVESAKPGETPPPLPTTAPSPPAVPAPVPETGAAPPPAPSPVEEAARLLTTVTAPSFAPRVPWHEATWFEVASNAGVLLFLMVAPIACILALLLIFK